jgi:hypothetical protein
MANYYEPTDQQVEGYKAWVESRPDNVRRVAEKFTPWGLYRLNDGNRATLVSFGEGEDGAVTLTVNITSEFNVVLFDRQVFGVNPDSLEPCELPAADEALGAVMTYDEVQVNLPAMRAMAAASREH